MNEMPFGGRFLQPGGSTESTVSIKNAKGWISYHL